MGGIPEVSQETEISASEAPLFNNTTARLNKKAAPSSDPIRMGPSSSDYLDFRPFAEAPNQKSKRPSVDGGGFPDERRGDRRADRGSPAGAGVPAGLGWERTVVARGDVVEGAVDRRELGVDERSQRAYPLAKHLVDASREAGPKRGHGARAPDHRSLSIDVNVVTGDRVGIPRNIRHAAPDEIAGIYRRRHVGSGLGSRLGEKGAYASARGAFLVCHFVPDDLCAVLAVGGGEFRSAAGDGVGTRGREVHVLQAVGHAVGRTDVARGIADSYAQRRGVLG